MVSGAIAALGLFASPCCCAVDRVSALVLQEAGEGVVLAGGDVGVRLAVERVPIIEVSVARSCILGLSQVFVRFELLEHHFIRVWAEVELSPL